MCMYQENDSESSCSTEPYGEHSYRDFTLLWKESVLVEGTANGVADTYGCWIKRQMKLLPLASHLSEEPALLQRCGSSWFPDYTIVTISG